MIINPFKYALKNQLLTLKLAILAFALMMIPNTFGAIEITQGRVEAMPISVADFQGEDISAQQIPEVILKDLEWSGLFRAVKDPSLNALNPLNLTVSSFSVWQVAGVNFLVSGEVKVAGNILTVRFRLYDVSVGTVMLSQKISVPLTRWRKAAHMISDGIYKRITGEEGIFDSQILYVDETGPKGKGKSRTKRLAIMDLDGANHRYLTSGAHLVLTPRFSPTSMNIAYLQFMERKAAKVYTMNLETGSNKLLGQFAGMQFAPRFSPDGEHMVMSLAKDGNTALYNYNLKTKKLIKITQTDRTPNSPEQIDTSPCYSPDGEYIVFTSDRDGNREKIFVMKKDGSNQHRISDGNGKYSQPFWSPRGDLIVFTKLEFGNFYIGVMNPDGSNERLIAQGYLVEAPVWSPNGRTILFTQESRNKQRGTRLYTIDLTGRNLRLVNTPREASDGAWSKLQSERYKMEDDK